MPKTSVSGCFQAAPNCSAPPLASFLHQPDVLSICIYDQNHNLLLGGENGRINAAHPPQTCLTNNESIVETSGDETATVLEQPVFINTSNAPEESLFFNLDDNIESQPIGYVLIRFSKKPLLANHTSLLWQMSAITIALLAILLPLSLVIVKQLTAPLRALLLQVRKQLNTENANSNDLTLLQDTFTTMLEELNESFLTINSYRESLEQQVEKRTEELLQKNKDLSNTLNELKQTQMQLVHSEKMASLGLLSTGLAHEINNALTIIKGSVLPLNQDISNILRQSGSGRIPDSTRSEERIDRLLSHMDTGINRINSLINDLMTFARPSAGTKKLADINRELETAMSLLTTSERFSQKIHRFFGEIEQVLSYGSQLGQVFFNVLQNSFHAIDDEGSITITTSMRNSHVIIIIADTGIGILPNDLPYIFDPFFTTKEVGHGTGLGLGICRSIIKEHGGDIIIESTPGQGTEVFISLPAFSAITTANDSTATATMGEGNHTAS